MAPPVYGLMAEFEDPNTLVAAAAQARDAGYRRMDATRRFRSKSCTRPSDRITAGCR